MANISQLKRQKMLDFLNKIRAEHQDDETRLAINEIENALTEKKYGLVWEEHTERVDEEMVHNIPIFTEIEDRKIKSLESNDYNFLIEGDNLHSLKLLEKTHKGKIDVIYIDPPYNTENSLTYDDKKVDLKDSFRHSKWISFMEKRLRIARNLLSEEGIIFISIDDNEQANLKLLCDEIFNEDNFFAQVIVQSNKRGQTYKQLAKTHEYLLIYTKSPEAEFNEISKTDEDNDLNLVDNISNFNIRELRNRNPKFGKHNRPNLFYPFYVNPKIVDKDGFSPISLNKTEEFSIEVLPYNSKNIESCWRWGKELSEKNYNSNTLNSNLVAKAKKDGNYNIYEKYRKTTYKAKTIWNEIEMLTEKGTVQLGEMELAGYFDFPKPVELIKKCLQIGTKENSVILDFFAGSGTTGEAVLELNKEDNGNRKYILCTNNEINEERLLKYQEDILGEKPKSYSQKEKKELFLSLEDIQKREKEIETWETEAKELLKTENCKELGICRSVTYNRLKTIISGKTISEKMYSKKIPTNLKYFKTEFIPKFSEDEESSIKYKMLNHVKELIELEYMCEIDGINNILIKNEEEFDEIINENLKEKIRLFISSDIFASREQQSIIDSKNIELIEIPEYYYKNELREVGEL